MTGDTPARDIAGRYQLREALSKRPVGRWFRAHDREVEVEVGLLMVNPELLPDEDSQNRFIGAVVEMRDINHRHLLKLYDVGREGGSVYLTTQLSQPIRALYKAEGVLEYVNSVADGLDSVHRAGQTHGRLTPSDVCEVQGLFKVAGAGLYSEIPPALAMRVWRTLSCFWAPEVVRGERPTPAADVYSLAAIAAVLLNNGKATDPHQALEVLRRDNAALYDALAPSLSVTPDDRPASPSLLVNRLANALDEDELDEQPTAYFVKSGPDEAEGMTDERTVLDVQVPPEIAAARPIVSSVATTEMAPARADTEDTRERASAPQGKRRSSKDLRKAHERTVVEATKLPPGVTTSTKSVPAMVVMGPPVGPAAAKQRALGKQTGEQAVPGRARIGDSTERMKAAGADVENPITSKAPPVVTSQSWAARQKSGTPARPSGQALEARISQARIAQDEAARPPQAVNHDEISERATTTPLLDAQPRPPRAPERRIPRQTDPQAEARELAYERAKTSRKAPARPSRTSMDTDTDVHGNAIAPASTSPDARPSKAHLPETRPAEVRPLEVRPEPSPAPIPVSAPAPARMDPPAAYPPRPDYPPQPGALGHYAPPAGRPAPRGESNLTWLYVVIAAVLSASLAIFVAMALFGN